MEPTSFVYKETAEGCGIGLDVYPSAGSSRPFGLILFIHGGSLIGGSRKSFEGTWAEKISGLDPETRLGEFKPLCPYQNITSDYPLTLQLHGDLDDNVPYQQAVMMASRLDRNRVENELITIEGGPHGFYQRMLGDAQIDAAMDVVMAFLSRHIG